MEELWIKVWENPELADYKGSGPGKAGRAELDWLGPWRIPGAQFSLQAAPRVNRSHGGGSRTRRGA